MELAANSLCQLATPEHEIGVNLFAVLATRNSGIWKDNHLSSVQLKLHSRNT